jgi:hypothetical protein
MSVIEKRSVEKIVLDCVDNICHLENGYPEKVVVYGGSKEYRAGFSGLLTIHLKSIDVPVVIGNEVDANGFYGIDLDRLF